METFSCDFRESNEFLNLLLDNINVAVLLADENLRIQLVNSSFLQLFGKPEADVLAKGFGRATDCKYRVEEDKECGETSQCDDCPVRHAISKTILENLPVDKMSMERVFYISGRPVTKYLQITTRPLQFQGRKMILVILYDVTEMEEQKTQLQEKQKQIECDLEAAAGIQRSLLPDSVSQNDALDIAWKFEPCRRVGGDIFNIVYRDKERVDLCMLDVCGHGVAAAFIAVSVSQFLQSRRGFFGKDADAALPSAVLTSLDRAFPFERFNTYFTMLYMTVDLRDGILAYSSAGHPPPILLPRNGGLEILGRHGPSIGLGTGDPFVQEKKTLHRGDKIVLYTDGIPEIHNPAGEIFGNNRFHDILKKYHSQSPRDLVDTLCATAKTFRDTVELEDDITLLIAQYVGS
jgi:sigma-B regulation protein RsbU (phosphoserine phosphatase)